MTENIEQEDYNIISLGYDCSVRRYLTMSGLKKTKSEGELSMPFDLCVTPIKSLIDILQTDFQNYFEGLKYKKNVWMNKKYRILYNHDKDCLENQKIKLIIRFAKRIENFNNILNSSPFIFFVIKTKCSMREIDKLYKIIQQKRVEKPFKIIVLDTELKIKSKILNNNIILVQVKHPFKRPQDWWLPENINSESSKVFQNQLCTAVEQEIAKIFEVKHYCAKDMNDENGQY